MREKIDSYSQGVYQGDNGPLQVYADDSVICKKKKKLKKDWVSNQRQNENERQNQHITH